MGCPLQQDTANGLQQHLVGEQTHYQVAEWYSHNEQVRVQGMAQVRRVQQKDVTSLFTT
jgi:hypothetical protein